MTSRLRIAAPIAAALALIIVPSLAPRPALAQTTVTSDPPASFTLGNGLQVVVIPDHRTPVVTQMIWYKVGSADETPGKSGLAHFLEHLMFKGTARHPAGEFSQTVLRVGGNENAFTSVDYTGYFQRVPREQLQKMMEFEADRMTGLILKDENVLPERDVVLEEYNMRVANNPEARLTEQIMAALYLNHPYGRPVIGWHQEIEKLDREDALAFYRRFYAPNNAILVIAGDVDAKDVRPMAEQTFGQVAPQPAIPARRIRPQEPEPVAPRTVTLADARVEQPSLKRYYLVPSATTAAAGESPALDVLAQLMGNGSNSYLYRALVVDKPLAVSAGAGYQGTSLDPTAVLDLGLAEAGRRVLADRTGDRPRDRGCRAKSRCAPRISNASRPSSSRRRSTPRTTRRRWRAGMAARSPLASASRTSAAGRTAFAPSPPNRSVPPRRNGSTRSAR